MTLNLVIQRLYNQQLVQHQFDSPEEVVGWFGAVQSQDYLGAKWAVGQRYLNGKDAEIDEAFNRGSILRTHLLRPTWHFVLPKDIGWILDLTAPRVKVALSSYLRKLEINADLISRSSHVLGKAVEGGNYLTRSELASILARSGIDTESLRLNHLLILAELDKVICSGPRRGKQFTYALFEERASQARSFARDEALVELARRYFTSHGPATLKDFTWWSGLTTVDARQALESISSLLTREEMNGKMYWFLETSLPQEDISHFATLLPNYDEFTVGYSDRSAIFERHQLAQFHVRGDVLNNILLLEGCLAGVWKRILQKDEVVLDLQPFERFSESETLSIATAARRYGKFLGLPIRIK